MAGDDTSNDNDEFEIVEEVIDLNDESDSFNEGEVEVVFCKFGTHDNSCKHSYDAKHIFSGSQHILAKDLLSMLVNFIDDPKIDHTFEGLCRHIDNTYSNESPETRVKIKFVSYYIMSILYGI